MLLTIDGSANAKISLFSLSIAHTFSLTTLLLPSTPPTLSALLFAFSTSSRLQFVGKDSTK